MFYLVLAAYIGVAYVFGFIDHVPVTRNDLAIFTISLFIVLYVIEARLGKLEKRP